MALFVGVIRNHDGGHTVVRLNYHQAHSSAAAQLASVVEQTARGHGVSAVSVEHRIGTLLVGEIAVVVAVGAAHRARRQRRKSPRAVRE